MTGYRLQDRRPLPPRPARPGLVPRRPRRHGRRDAPVDLGHRVRPVVAVARGRSRARGGARHECRGSLRCHARATDLEARLAAACAGICPPARRRRSTVLPWRSLSSATSASLRAFDPRSLMRPTSQAAPAGSLDRDPAHRQPRADPGGRRLRSCPRLLAGPLERHRPPTSLVWWSCNNTAGQRLLEAGTVHAAAVHRRADEEPSRASGHEIVGFAAWREGLVVAERYADVGALARRRARARPRPRQPRAGLGGPPAARRRPRRDRCRPGRARRLRQRLQRPPARGILDRGRPGRHRGRERAGRAGLRARLRAVAGGDLRAACPPLAARHRGGPGPAGRARRQGAPRPASAIAGYDADPCGRVLEA